MAEAFFNRVADDVLMATEQLQALLTTGSLSLQQQHHDDGAGGGGESTAAIAVEFEWNDNNMDLDSLSEEEIQRLLEQEDMMEHSPLKGIADGVIGNIASSQIGPQTPWEHLDAFRTAITWSEPFILGMIVFQMVFFLLCLYVSRKDRGLVPRVATLVLIGGLVRSAEWINTWAGEHWESFAMQNYFDSRGIFISIFLSGPLLVDSLLMLLMYLSEAGQLLVEVKKQELKNKKKKQNTTSSKSKTKKQN